MKIHCNQCNRETNHNIVAKNVKRELSYELDGLRSTEFWEDKRVQVLECGSCSELTLRTSSIWCDDAPYFPEYNVNLLPKRGNKSIIPVENFRYVPESILNIYAETVEALRNEIPILCAGGIRAILEAICKNKKIKDGLTENGERNTDLFGKIYGLTEHGFITQQHAKDLQHHRYLGNKALHELKAPTQAELQTAIEILGHTLDTIYEVHAKGIELKKKIELRKNNE